MLGEHRTRGNPRAGECVTGPDGRGYVMIQFPCVCVGPRRCFVQIEHVRRVSTYTSWELNTFDAKFISFHFISGLTKLHVTMNVFND